MSFWDGFLIGYLVGAAISIGASLFLWRWVPKIDGHNKPRIR